MQSLNAQPCARSLRARAQPRRARSVPSAPRAAVSETLCEAPVYPSGPGERPLHVLVAGGGIGGLVLALVRLPGRACRNKGMNVTVFERDASAIRGEGKYRGPIQIQSNALAALEAIDAEVAQGVMAEGCITGDRINGLVDGVSGDWYCKFDTFHPAVDNGLPVTRVISRVTLQSILAGALPREMLLNNCKVAAYEDGEESVTAVLEDGRRITGDVLVGADGIWSKIRTQLIGPTEAAYSNYTCYTGIADFVPPDVDTVGYRVFLGNKQYFVSSDVGQGKQQWYAFNCEAAGGSDVEGSRKERLLAMFGHWCDDVTDLVRNTPEEDVLRRDIYDRPPILTWSRGRVCLLGDSAHAMQPNLGQGGCMAIEDAYTLAAELQGALTAARGVPAQARMWEALDTYEGKRKVRCGTIHGLARMAAEMASTYKAYLGEGLGPLSFIEKLHIPHPGSASGKLVMQFAMPFVLDWVLGGNADVLGDKTRVTYLRNSPQAPKLAGGMTDDSFAAYLSDDDALLRATNADWLLVPMEVMHGCDLGPGVAVASGEPALQLSAAPNGTLLLGRVDDATRYTVMSNELVSRRHAQLEVDEKGDWFLTDLGSTNGTWLNRGRLRPQGRARVVPGDDIWLGARGETGVRLRVKLAKRETVAAGDLAPAAAR